jgi:ParB family chromosome partitioning protein
LAWTKALPKAETPGRAAQTPHGGRADHGQDGSVLGAVDISKGAMSFRPSARNSDFAGWLHQNAGTVFSRLHEEFLSQSKKKG